MAGVFDLNMESDFIDVIKRQRVIFLFVSRSRVLISKGVETSIKSSFYDPFYNA